MSPSRPTNAIKAQQFGDQYWRHVVVNCKTQRELDLIQDPAAKLVSKEKVSLVRYMLAQGECRKAAAAGSSAEGTQEVGS